MFSCLLSSITIYNLLIRILPTISQQDNDNPYLQGDKLPIAAKKGDRINM